MTPRLLGVVSDEHRAPLGKRNLGHRNAKAQTAILRFLCRNLCVKCLPHIVNFFSQGHVGLITTTCPPLTKTYPNLGKSIKKEDSRYKPLKKLASPHATSRPQSITKDEKREPLVETWSSRYSTGDPRRHCPYSSSLGLRGQSYLAR